jgi:hypothetical protein
MADSPQKHLGNQVPSLDRSDVNEDAHDLSKQRTGDGVSDEMAGVSGAAGRLRLGGVDLMAAVEEELRSKSGRKSSRLRQRNC